MKNSISRSDFYFIFAGHGHYKVTFTSRLTGKTWTKIVDDMHLIDLTKNCDDPKKVDLNILKRLCKK